MIDKKYPFEKTESEWKEQLSENEFKILRKKDTESAHTGAYNLHFEKGSYKCKGCNSSLFESNHKFNSSCGWPSFDNAIEGTIEYIKDSSFGMIRTEILCTNCGGHLGHVFDDGPGKSGLRFCVNSASIDFDSSKS